MYKKGQLLRCVKPGGSAENPVIEGEIYTYAGLEDCGGYDPLIRVEERESSFYPNRFVPVNKITNEERIRRREACCR
jgi:hypothetical protein